MLAIETDRLWLQQHSIDEFARYAKLWSSTGSEVAGVPSIPPLSHEEAWARLLRFVGHWSVFGFGPFIVVDKATNSAVGEVGFAHFHRGHGADFDGSPEAMWKIDHRSQGKGIASEAVLAAIEWFDQKLIAKRTVCMIDPHNTASLRIAAHFGFNPFADTTYRNNTVLLFQRLTE